MISGFKSDYYQSDISDKSDQSEFRRGGRMIYIYDMRMNDGSRHFTSLPQTVLWYEVRDHVSNLPGAVLTGFICDDITEAWIDFTYMDYKFSINDQFGDYWFFVDEPSCPDEILGKVLAHFRSLLY